MDISPIFRLFTPELLWEVFGNPTEKLCSCTVTPWCPLHDFNHEEP